MCSGRRARMAAIYHFDLCKAILIGFRNQMTSDGKCQTGMVGMLAEEDDTATVLHVGMTEAQASRAEAEGEVFHDDMTGQLLSPDLVRAARQKESVQRHHLWQLEAIDRAPKD